MIIRRRRRLVTGLALGLATAALAAPSAQADAWFTDQSSQSASVRPDDRGARVTATSLIQANDAAHSVRPDDRAGARGVGAFQSPERPVSSPTSGNDFSWGDAGIGLGGVLAAMLILGAALLTLRRSRSGQPASA